MTDLRKAESESELDEGLRLGALLWPRKMAAELRRLHEENQALRQALAQPEQEPVGYVSDSGKGAYILLGVDLDDDTPLYTAPPKRWVGLTDGEIRDLWSWSVSRAGEDSGAPTSQHAFARAIEAKLKEKNT